MSGVSFLASHEARTLLERMRERTIMVVGDVMLDEWIWGSVTRISPEAPVPVVAVNDHSFTLGGAGNVASNLRALGAKVQFVGTIGNDRLAERVHVLLKEIGVGCEGVFALDDRPTTRKTRIVAHNQQVVRADWESTAPLSESDRARVLAFVQTHAAGVDAIVLSDYAKGLLSRDIVEASLAAPLTIADPKPQNLRLFHGVTCVAPNLHEAASASGVPITDDRSLERAGETLLHLLACKYVVITRGEAGMSLFAADGGRAHVPAVARTVFDVSGAGDTVVAVLSLALAADAPVEVALQLANFAAAAVVEKLGTATANASDILSLVNHGSHG